MEKQIKKATRPWHEEKYEEEKPKIWPIDQVHKPGFEIRSIDQVDKPDRSTGSINQVINLADRPVSKIMLDKLRGNPLRVCRFLFSTVEDFNEKITRKIQLAEIMQQLELTRDSARTGLKFLCKNGLISVVDYLAGLYGWTRYKIQDEIFNEIWSINQIDKPGLKPGLSSSSGSIKTITTEIDQIDIMPLEKIGFAYHHAEQLLKTMSKENVQSSIYHFAFDLENNEKWKSHKTPLNLFIGSLRKGRVWVADGYISPEEKALRELLESKKKEAERFAKLKEELYDAEFKKWELNLLEGERRTILLERPKIPAEVAFRLYFKENIWPPIWAEIKK